MIMDMLKWLATNVGAKHLISTTVLVMILAGAVWIVFVQTMKDSKPEQATGSAVTNTTNGTQSPIITDNHGKIEIQGAPNSDRAGKQKSSPSK
jgi:ABC-type Na+ efflux pump permease subunit